jgi:hypothetical protein
MDDLEAALRAVDKVRPAKPLQAVARWLENPELLRLNLSTQEVVGIILIQARYRGKLQRRRHALESYEPSRNAGGGSRTGGSGSGGRAVLVTGAILSRDEDSYTYLHETVQAGLMEPLLQCATVQPDDPAAFIAAWVADTNEIEPTRSPR